MAEEQCAVPKTSAEREMLWALRDLAVQTLQDKQGPIGYELFSGFIRANATALRLLEKYGMMETLDPDKGTETPEWTRCVSGHALPVEEIVAKWKANRSQ